MAMSDSDRNQWTGTIRFKDAFGVFVLSPDDVEFRTGATSGRSYVVSDSERRGMLGRIVERILSPHSSPRRWNAAETELLRELMPQLAQSGIVEAEAASPAPREGLGVPIPIIGRPLTEARVGIVGHGVLGRAVGRLVDGMPWRSSTVIESSSVAPAATDGASTRAESWVAIGNDTRPEPRPRPASDHEWVETVRAHDWIIAAQDSFEPEELTALNAAALRVGIPWSLVCFDGYEGWVGPTFVPAQTACFGCFRRRLFAGAAEPKHIFGDPGVKVYRVPAPWSVGPETSAWVSLIASMFAMELLAAVEGRSFTLNHLLIVHRMSLTFQRESVLRLPRCPDCSPIRSAPKPNVFSHVLPVARPTRERR
jgi:bacteriocin biosynthesis cyclodehydratase domain-containing protein